MLRRRRSRTDRVVRGARQLPALVLVGGAAAVTAALVAVAFAARRWLWRGVAVVADAVEEVGDAIEDAAEDVADAARERAGPEERASD